MDNDRKLSDEKMEYLHWKRQKELDRKFTQEELSRMTESEMRQLAGEKWGILWGVDLEDEKMENIRRSLLENDDKVFYEDFYKAREEAVKRGSSPSSLKL